MARPEPSNPLLPRHQRPFRYPGLSGWGWLSTGSLQLRVRRFFYRQRTCPVRTFAKQIEGLTTLHAQRGSHGQVGRLARQQLRN